MPSSTTSPSSSPNAPNAPKAATPDSASSHALVASHLTRKFGDYTAVEDLSFNLPRGQLVAFLGPNGAGKSTTMRLLTGYLTPTSGSASVAGHDVVRDRLAAAIKVGYLPESGPFYPDMTPVDFLRFIAAARSLGTSTTKARIEAVTDQCKLGEVLGKPIGKLSKGFKQRVGLAAAILHDPEVLILDEPTAGLDPNQVDQVRTLLKGLAKSRTVLLSTHILSEVRALADRILLIHRGKLRHDGGPGSLGKNEREMEDTFRSLTRD